MSFVQKFEIRYYAQDGTTEVASAKAPGAFFAVLNGVLRTRIGSPNKPDELVGGVWVTHQPPARSPGRPPKDPVKAPKPVPRPPAPPHRSKAPKA
jgi:hypothetical protein